jgi:hypothetical protein
VSDKHHFRSRLEFLDDRIVPGFGSLNLGWTDGTGDGLFQTAANWRNLATGATSIRPPAAGDRLTFDGSLTNDSLTNLHGFNLDETTADYLSISINNYSGTVTIAPDSTAGLTTSNFTLASGAISQPVSGTGLTVLTNFSWTGGTLNASANAASITLYGNGDITPANAGTVTTNDTLTFIGAQNAPTTTTVNPGTIAFGAVGGGMVIGAFASVTAKTYTQGDIIGITKNQAGAQSIQIQANATLGCVGPGTISYNLPVGNQGTFNLTGSVRVNLTATNNPNYIQDGAAQLRIENGSLFSSSTSSWIKNGTVYLMMNSALPADQQTATISGTFDMSGGTILFSAPSGIGTNPLVYGTFTAG